MKSPKATLTIAVRKRDRYTCQLCGGIQGGRHDAIRRGSHPLVLLLWPHFDEHDLDPNHYCCICAPCFYRIRFGMIADPDGNWHHEVMFPTLPEGETPTHIYGTFRRRDKITKPWRAYIWNGTKTIHLGAYRTQIEAARAYDKKAYELFGDKAKLNFPSAMLDVSEETREEENQSDEGQSNGLLAPLMAPRTD